MKQLKWVVALMVALCVLCGTAFAEGVLSTNVVMRVSRLTQDAVVNEGEDLSMDVSIDGVEPATYQWYLNDAPIYGATQKVYNLVDAKEEDAGVYRLDAYDENGRMALSMDIAVRVLTKNVPQSGDNSLPIELVVLVMGAAALLMAVKIRRQAA